MKSKIIIIILTVLLGCLLCCPNLTLVKQKDREIHNISLPTHLIEEIQRESYNLSDVEIINYSVEKTATLLEFSFQESIDLNANSKGHCVTYARLCATICNVAFAHNNIDSKAKCVVGYVKWGNINLCSLSSKLFRKHSNNFVNHDFVEINGYNYTIFVDPTMYDATHNDLKLINE